MENDVGERRKKGESMKSLPFYGYISVLLEIFSKVHMPIDISNYMGNIHNCICKIHWKTVHQVPVSLMTKSHNY